ncbi:60Kd inner membrane protein-domain-containing protein [Echria macrotheca]|uniref:60Kd inner membrane protein-domain-containing protein n=1 Tax=Echria macrotheca TaxID=438768 RepID=A0AAJ0B742_9PEZI|nr:60Kd inner membrane protein-domain-containing protein [Echria macrotheca]
MLPSRGILRAGQSVGLAKAAVRTPTMMENRRQFGTVLARSPLSSQYSARRIASPIALAASHQLLASRQARYASTQPTAPPAVPADPPIPELSSSPIDLTGADLLNIPEQIGFLKTLGLDYGWGPTSIVQWCLEHIYVYTGLPWWASLVVLAVGVRAVIFKPAIRSSAAAQKMQDLKADPKYNAVVESMRAATVTGGGTVEVLARRAEQVRMHKAAGYSGFDMLLPQLIQIPLGFGAFRLLKGMADLPVASMENGGLLWFTDLTVADPFFLLPLATACLFAMSMRIPIRYMAKEQQQMTKMMSLVMMPIGALFTITLPAAVQLYFVLTAVLQLLQSSAFYNPTIRKFLGLGPLKWGPSGAAQSGPRTTKMLWQSPRTLNTTARPAKSSDTVFSSLQSGISQAKAKMADMSAKKEQKLAARKAQEYEERRALEDRERQMARREKRSS